MPRFLIDENLSPHIAEHMRFLGYDAHAVREAGMTGAPDEAIIPFARTQGLVIVTGDIEFGEMFYHQLGEVSMVVLRSKTQGMRGFVDVLEYLHHLGVLNTIATSHYLVLASVGKHRIRRYGV